MVWCSPGPIYLPVVTGYRRRSEGLLAGSALGPCPVLTDLLGAPTAFRALATGTCFRCQVSGARCQWWLVGLKGSWCLRVVSSLAGSALGPCPVLTDLLGAPTAFRALATGTCFRCQVSGARCQWWLVGLKGSWCLRVVSSLAGSALGPCPVLTDLLGAPTAFRALATGTCFRCQVSGARCQWWLVGLKGSWCLRVVSSLAGSALGPCPVLTDLLGAPTAFRALATGTCFRCQVSGARCQWWLVGLKGSWCLRVVSSLAGSALGPCPVLTDLLGAPTAFRALTTGTWLLAPGTPVRSTCWWSPAAGGWMWLRCSPRLWIPAPQSRLPGLRLS